jgi:hypothetical protein
VARSSEVENYAIAGAVCTGVVLLLAHGLKCYKQPKEKEKKKAIKRL